MAALQNIVICRVNQSQFDQTLGFGFVVIEFLKQHVLVAFFKTVLGVLIFWFLENVAILDAVCPFQIIDTVNVLNVFSQSFQAIGNLGSYRIHLQLTNDLEISELRNFHPIEPDFPANPGTAH